MRFRVGYLGWVPHPAFLETAAGIPELEVVRIPSSRGDRESGWT